MGEHAGDERESFIVDCLVAAFSDLMEADPDAFRTKFRKMAADPFAFYRGSACVFYADIADREDRWAPILCSGIPTSTESGLWSAKSRRMTPIWTGAS